MNTRELGKQYKIAHNIMRNIDGLQPQEAFDELLKYLIVRKDLELKGLVRSAKAKDIRSIFKQCLFENHEKEWVKWSKQNFSLSDACLEMVHDHLSSIAFEDLDYDIRSHAIKEFLTPEIRKGLGVFLTPDEVVRFIVEYISPKEGANICDPACGSATFLIEAQKYAQLKGKDFKLVGKDKNPRMLALAQFNLEEKSIDFKSELIDSITDEESESYDVILTNPPFGVSLDSRAYKLEKYLSCLDEGGNPLAKQSSEIVFIEHCLNLLKPGGSLGIVIPKSIATNNSLQNARVALSSKGYISSVISLPSETFATTGTQTTTIILIVKKYSETDNRDSLIDIKMANISNVGFDSTGREREGSQLTNLAEKLTKITDTDSKGLLSVIKNVKKSDSFRLLSEFFISSETSLDGIRLDEVCEFIGTGRTPARSAYTESGNFLIKVGNLSGTGINWDARDRNYISDEEVEKREKAKKPLLLEKFDILLTSSAHSPVYIAKKSDIFLGSPDFISNKVSFVGEVMLIRPKKSMIDPFVLLAFLRNPKTIQRVQNMVRGQTAHLHPADLGRLVVPESCFEKSSPYIKVAEIVKKQAELSEEINLLNSALNQELAFI